MIRHHLRRAAVLAALTGALLTTATPANARPGVDQPTYCGPPKACAVAEAVHAVRVLLPWAAR